MFLKNLKIEKHSELIRDIPFRKGINLIVDETHSDNKIESGNNVGKTTVLRLIDFCLGGNGTNIYKDPEFKNKTNTEIERFLKDNNVTVTLQLKKDLDDQNSSEIEIRRNFLQRKQKLQEINGEQVSNIEFPRKLKELIFHSLKDKPTFRQIIAKNIRDEKNRLLNTVKVLHATTTSQEYEALYLFWFGIDLDVSDRKQRLMAQRRIEESLQTRLRKESSLSQIKQKLIVVKRNIDLLFERKESFNLNEQYEVDLRQLNEIKSELNKEATVVSRLELRRALIVESTEELDAEATQIDVEKIRRLYGEAKALFPEIQKSFEETLRFHNSMVLEKKKFITEELPGLEAKIQQTKGRVTDLRAKEKALSLMLMSSGAMEDLEKLILELNLAHEQKGGLEEQEKLWEMTLAKTESIDNEIRQIDAGIQSLEATIQERMSEFNMYFSDISSRLYGEQFVLSPERGEKGYELNISSVSGNLGTGKKKGQMAAFDLAYIQFADANNIECLHFILHDQIENIHANQISSLLTEIVSEINCQYVLPVLRDKLPRDIDVSKYEVVSLSQEDKLFRVD